MDEQKLQELLQSQPFMEKVLSAQTVEEVKSLFSAEGVDLTDEDINVLGQAIEAAIQNGGNLSDADLENISGGVSDALVAVLASGAVLALSAAAVAGGVVTHKAEKWYRQKTFDITKKEIEKWREINPNVK